MLLSAFLLAPIVAALAYAPTHHGGIDVHDPACVHTSGEYYCFSTGGLISYWKARSMAGPWSYQGTVFERAPRVGGTNLWAPDVHLVHGVWYLYYASSIFGSRNSKIGLATSSNLQAGSWEDHGEVISSNPKAASAYGITNAIDPNLVLDHFGNGHLNWGSFWSDIYQVRLDEEMASPASSVTPTHLSQEPSGSRAQEGSFVYRHGEYYYLWVSQGQCCNFNGGRSLPPAGHEYKIIVGRANNVAGPFLDRDGTPMTSGGGTTMLASNGNVYAPGGQGVFTDGDGSDVLFYHFLDRTVSYDVAKLGYNKITYVDGWPVLS